MTHQKMYKWQRWAASLLLALAVLSTTRPSEAGIKFCAKWIYSYVDQGFGEDGLKHASGSSYGTTTAAYASYKLAKSGQTLEDWAYLNSSGCSVEVPSVAGTYQLYVRTELEKPDGARFEVRNGTATGPTEFILSFTVSSPPSSGSYTKSYGSTAGDPVANAMAAATQFARESAIGIAADGEHIMVVNHDGWAHASGKFAYFGTYQGINDASWKYVIGHEVGHTVQTALFGMHSGAYDLAEPPQNVCNCTHIPDDEEGDPEDLNDDHCIQSLEKGGAAQNEGWGHFIALDLMNDDSQTDAKFVYYKDFRCPDQWPGCPYSGQMDPPLVFDGKAKYAWMDSHCQQASTYRGIEVDWMNFYYAMHATGGSNAFYFTQFRDTYRRACNNGICSGMLASWSTLSVAVGALYGGTRYDNWIDNGADFGVDQ